MYLLKGKERQISTFSLQLSRTVYVVHALRLPTHGQEMTTSGEAIPVTFICGSFKFY